MAARALAVFGLQTLARGSEAQLWRLSRKDYEGACRGLGGVLERWKEGMGEGVSRGPLLLGSTLLTYQ